MLLACAIWLPSGRASPDLKAFVEKTGAVIVSRNDSPLARVQPVVFLRGWRGKYLADATSRHDDNLGGELDLGPGGAAVAVLADVTASESGLKVSYRLSPGAETEVESLCAVIFLGASQWIGAPYQIGDRIGRIPRNSGETWLGRHAAARTAIGPAPRLGGLVMTVARTTEGTNLLQDSRKWNDDLEIRVLPDEPDGGYSWTQPVDISFSLSFNRPVKTAREEAFTLGQCGTWAPLAGPLEILPGSALDFSRLVPRRSFAGASGRLRPMSSRPDVFEFEAEPGKTARFYGINLCFGALFPDERTADFHADRIMRLGYNSVRIHHYESMAWEPKAGIVAADSTDGLSFNPDALDRFDRFLAALRKRGIYLTTDLYVSRSLQSSVVFGSGNDDLVYRFRTLVYVSRQALDNWKRFARAFLDHVNPYTGLAYKDDPALFLVSLMNEDALTNYIGDMQSDRREADLWDAAYANWMEANSLDLSSGWDSPLFKRFLIETQRRVQAEMIAFLKNEIGLKTPISSLNGNWPDYFGTELNRMAFDYVDNHCYWDHPRFIARPWALPSRGYQEGAPAVMAGGMERNKALTRLIDRPFTLSEFNYCAPNPNRAEGGVLAPAFAALQGWSGIWRFSYSHSRVLPDSEPPPAGYFDLLGDPIRQVGEYAGMALFLRGDLPALAGTLAVSGSPGEFDGALTETLGGDLSELGWCVRMGCAIGSVTNRPGVMFLPLSERNPDPRRMAEDLREAGLISVGNATDPLAGIYESGNGAVRLDTTKGIFTVNTPRTVCAIAPAGSFIEGLGPLCVRIGESRSVFCAIGLDDKPLYSSRRILAIHLTDVQNTGARFRDENMRVLEQWGELPRLVRKGTADVELMNLNAPELKVWQLDLSGRRIASLPVSFAGKTLLFRADTTAPPRATLCYEIAAE